jgi:hypothetical protein
LQETSRNQGHLIAKYPALRAAGGTVFASLHISFQDRNNSHELTGWG